MKKLFKKFTALFLGVGTVVVVSACSNSAAKQEAQLDSSTNGVSLANSSTANSIENGNIFHAWNWSMSTIEANLDNIKNAGFTAVQTSPMQPQKDYWAGNTAKEAWWKLYQPLGFSIATRNNALGTKSQLQSMVKAAHNKGLKVIVDVVANHLAGSATQLDGAVQQYEPTIYGSNGNLSGGAMLHSETQYGASDGGNTTVGNIGLPDLNTHNTYVANRVLSLCKEYIDCGVDGFRFDAAKHIETDNAAEPNSPSAFWPTVIGGSTSYANAKGKETPYYYGEILYSCGNNRSYSWYTKWMDVIDNKTGNDLRNSFNSGYASAQSAYYTTNLPGEDVVVWAESHDTYANDERESTGTSIYNINKTYAIMGSRKGAKALYFARPTDTAGSSAWESCQTKLGAKGSEAYTWAQVVGVNKFRNYWGTSAEYVANNGGFAQVVRYNGSESGMVLVNSGNGTSVSNVAVPSVMKNGTYKDYVTGNTFTVSGGKVSGTMDSYSGIAILYSATSSNTNNNNNNEQNNVDTTNMNKNTIYYENTKNWSNVYVYAWNNSSSNATWPGVKMTKTSNKANGHYIYSYTSTNFLSKYDHVIFSNGSGTQTSDIAITYNKYDFNGKAELYSTSTNTNNNVDQTMDKNTIYYVNTKKWSRVYCYAWTGNGGSGNQNSSWPGVKMTKTGTKVNGYDLYSYTSTNFLGKYTNVIFTNNSGSQTKDITITKNQYDFDGNATLYTASTNNNNTTNTTNSNAIYFINTKKWSRVYCYAWTGNGGSGNQNSSWPGVKMTKTGKKVNGYDVYVLEQTGFYAKWDHVIFTNNYGSQTKDITITKNCYNAAGTATTYTG